MKVFAISDLHLSFQTDKPMDLFGDQWANYEQRIMDDWNARVGPGDVGIIAGDISWAMKMEQAAEDFAFLKKLNGTKIIIRGNHDYWWKSIGKIRETLGPDIIALQNDSVKIGDFVFAGTRGWRVPERRMTQSGEDKKIYEREIIRFELALKDAAAKITAGGVGEAPTLLAPPAPAGHPPLQGGKLVYESRAAGEQSLEITGKQKAFPQLESFADSPLAKGGGAKGDGGCERVEVTSPAKLIAILHYPPFNATRDDSPFTALCEKYGVTACVYGHLHGKNCRAELLTQKNGVDYYLTSCDLLQHKLVQII